MNIQLGLAPIIALLAGILILVTPRLLNYIVAIYLIVIGVLGIVGAGVMGIGIAQVAAQAKIPVIVDA